MGLIIPYCSFIFCNTLNWYVSWYIFDQAFGVFWASLKVQVIKKKPAIWEPWVWSLEKGKVTQSSILAWRIPWTIVHGVAKSWTRLSDSLVASAVFGVFLYRFRHQLQTGNFTSSVPIYFFFLPNCSGWASNTVLNRSGEEVPLILFWSSFELSSLCVILDV